MSFFGFFTSGVEIEKVIWNQSLSSSPTGDPISAPPPVALDFW